MPNPEGLAAPLTGEPGAMVDEVINESGKLVLIYTFYDNYGQLSFCAEFCRDVSPKQISQLIDGFADKLLEINPNNLPDYELLDKVQALREQADNVPGL